jgi:hypothetical protein
MGKSEFLEQDLIPAAQKSGLLTAYLNLWDAREHPRGALISALARAASPDLDPIELHMSISALSFFNVANRYTFSQIFGKDMISPKALLARREVVVDMIERWCRPNR